MKHIPSRKYLGIFIFITFLLGCGSLAVKREISHYPHPLLKLLRLKSNEDSLYVFSEDRARTESLVEAHTLSPASVIMIEACNNYLEINPQSPKTAEVMYLKASVFYNSKLFDEARIAYEEIIEQFPKAPKAIEAVKMIAQSYYEQKEYEKAQTWYEKLKIMAGDEGSKSEAVARIAESIYRMAELEEQAKRYPEAAANYERVALEFPEATIADVALFNAGLAYEKAGEWSRAILVYQRLKNRYPDAKLVPKSIFRRAKCYENLKQWEDAAQTYLRLVATFPTSEFTPTSLYNAGFCFENSEKHLAAASTFEKLALTFPENKDAADVLFKAGELYGKIKEWVSVSRVHQEFSRRYGHDQDRIVQAECMLGVALYMQNQKAEAIIQLENAVKKYLGLGNPSAINKFYAAKAQFTIGKIYHEYQNSIKLLQPQRIYKRLLKNKSDYLEKAIEEYSEVIQYKLTEWTTRAIYQMGLCYEQFAKGLFHQERPENQSLEKDLALEMGIAQAVQEYLINNALPFYEQNVKLGITERIDNPYIFKAREKLTYLPYIAGKNYVSLVAVTEKIGAEKNLTGLALMTHKLRMLQKIAPFQEQAIALFLTCLEKGSIYQEFNEYYDQASGLITKISFTVAQTYGEVAEIARSAPIPQNFDDYETFVYKTKLLKQIEGYEENALTNFIKTLKIAQAYEILDEYVDKTKKSIPKLLFNRGRCYDLLCLSVFDQPPYPKDINESEKEEYRAQFEEVALTYQDQAFELYRLILEYAQNNQAVGEYVTHAYVRLYQNFPEEFGVKSEKRVIKSITSGPKWKCSDTLVTNWQTLEFDDQGWGKPKKQNPDPTLDLTGFPDKPPIPLGFPTSMQNPSGMKHAFFRRTFYSPQVPHQAKIYVVAKDSFSLYLNGDLLTKSNDTIRVWHTAQDWDLIGKLRQGKNAIAIEVMADRGSRITLYPYLQLHISTFSYLPRYPNSEEILDKKVVAEEIYTFPWIHNYSFKKESAD